MGRKLITTSIAPEVIIEQVQDSLQVRGWNRSEVAVDADLAQLSVEEEDDIVRLSCQGDCSLRLPHGAVVQVQSVGGSAALKLIEDQMRIGEVHGSLSLRDVDATQIDTVHGGLSVREASGDLRVNHVHGNADVRGIQGGCYLEEVKGNINLRKIEGEVQTVAQGNIDMQLIMMSGSDYRITADGNVRCRIPEDASVKLSLSSQAEVIEVRLPEESGTYQQADYDLIMGEGDASMKVSAGGSLHLIGQKSGRGEIFEQGLDLDEDLSGLPEGFSQQIARLVEGQIGEQVEQMTRQINEQMARLSERVGRAGLSPEEAEHIMEQALSASERETARAQEKIQRAQEKLERKLEAALHRRELKIKAADRRTRAGGRGTWSSTSAPDSTQRETVSEEERLMILRMLEQKKISLEEAEQLLAALEGRD